MQFLQVGKLQMANAGLKLNDNLGTCDRLKEVFLSLNGFTDLFKLSIYIGIKCTSSLRFFVRFIHVQL